MTTNIQTNNHYFLHFNALINVSNTRKFQIVTKTLWKTCNDQTHQRNPTVTIHPPRFRGCFVIYNNSHFHLTFFTVLRYIVTYTQFYLFNDVVSYTMNTLLFQLGIQFLFVYHIYI